jgi:predicted GNAT family N-acyltransferase
MIIRSPANDSEFEAYYALRWSVLRAPWNQAPGSEKDEFEGNAIHLAAWNESGKIVGVGRLHRMAGRQGQIRYMAVEPRVQGRGIGKALLQELEVRAAQEGMIEIYLNAREESLQFYTESGYELLGPAHLLFGAIPHFRMRKRLGGHPDLNISDPLGRYSK